MSRLAQAFRKAAASGTIGAWSVGSPLVADESGGLVAITDMRWDRADATAHRAIRRTALTSLEQTPDLRRLRRDAESISQEDVAALALRLYQPGAVGDRKRAVLFSAVGGEGRSAHVSAAVADVLSRSTTGSVCLADANLRTPMLHRQFDLPLEPGLSDVLCGACDIRSALAAVGPNLWLLPGGGRAADAVQHLTADMLRPRIAELLALFDYLVVDTSAANVHPDAGSIGPIVDGVVLVVSANGTRRETSRKTVDQLEEVGATVLGAVLLDRSFPIPEAIYRRL